MACVGLDLGTSASIVTRIKNNALETVLNDTSNRRTPAALSFSRGSRLFGDGAQAIEVANFLNTCKSMKRLVGLTWDEAQGEIARLPNKVRTVRVDGGGVGLQVDTSAGERPLETFDVAFLYGQYLGGIRRMYASCDAAVGIADCVVSCPDFFNSRQRQSLVRACALGGIRSTLIDESAAVCLAYGMWKNAEFSPSTSLTVGFVSMGYSSSSLTVANFTKDNFKILASVWDGQLGGRDIDALVVEKFAAEFQKKTGLDCRKDAKAMLKLQGAAERAKMVLTPEGVSKAMVSVEFLYQEADFAYSLTLEEFEELIRPACAQLSELLQRGLFDSLVPSLENVECIGGCSRVRAFKRTIAAGLLPAGSRATLLTTLNADEAIARGACLMAGILSPTVKVAAQIKLITSPRVIVVEYAGGAKIIVENQAEIKSIPTGTTQIAIFTSTGVPVCIYEGPKPCPPRLQIGHDVSGIVVVQGWPGCVNRLALPEAVFQSFVRKEAELLKLDERALKLAAEENAKEARKSSSSWGIKKLGMF